MNMVRTELPGHPKDSEHESHGFYVVDTQKMAKALTNDPKDKTNLTFLCANHGHKVPEGQTKTKPDRELYLHNAGNDAFVSIY